MDGTESSRLGSLPLCPLPLAGDDLRAPLDLGAAHSTYALINTGLETPLKIFKEASKLPVEMPLKSPEID